MRPKRNHFFGYPTHVTRFACFLTLCFLSSFVVQATEYRITPNDVFQNPSDYNAWNVSIDGNRALLGAYKFGNNGNNIPGAAYVYEYQNGQWLQTAKLQASDGVGDDGFGVQVHLSGDMALVGAASLTQTNQPGSVYVFNLNGAQWNQTTKLQANDASGGNNFGRSITFAMNQIIIGAQTDAELGLNAGAVYVFSQVNGNWTQTAKITPNEVGPGDFFGSALTSHANRFAVGAFGDFGGSAFVFKHLNNEWTLEQKLKPGDGFGNQLFGKSISMNHQQVIVGAPNDNDKGNGSGSAYVFTNTGVNWTESAKLVGADTASNDNFGTSVSISGAYVLVGALFADGNSGNNTGSAYLFKHENQDWSEMTQLNASNQVAEQLYGASVSLDQNWGVIGTDMLTSDLPQTNAAYIHDINTQQQLENINQGWVNGLGEISGNHITVSKFTATGGFFGTDFNASDIKTAYWGHVRLEFTGCNTAAMHYESLITTNGGSFGSGGYPLQRLAANQASADCDATGFENTTNKQWMAGTYFGGLERNGEGFTIDVLNDQLAIVTWFTYMPLSQ